uniref:Uncharacterized protein n=1 Tax=Glossina pallidipes TaxID=7398 RepID=A0A1A9Z307_GLOPL
MDLLLRVGQSLLSMRLHAVRGDGEQSGARPKSILLGYLAVVRLSCSISFSMGVYILAIFQINLQALNRDERKIKRILNHCIKISWRINSVDMRDCFIFSLCIN